MLCVAIPVSIFAQAPTIGIYTDATGSDCSLSDSGPGIINAYVVVRPGINGVAGAQFAAPPPACFTGTWVADVTVPGSLIIGNSQTGISVAMAGCSAFRRDVLTIQYYGYGTTATCCAFPVVADPSAGEVKIVDCFSTEVVATGLTSRINADASCPCVGNSPPLPPSNPVPPDASVGESVLSVLGWTDSDVDDNITGYDVYLGTSSSPPLVASNVPDPLFDPGPLDPMTSYYWRVVVRDAEGAETSGPEWSFTTRDLNSPPGIPKLVSPANGASGVAIDVELLWTGQDVDGDALEFDVYFGTDPSPPLVVAHRTYTSFQTQSLEYSTAYHWRIVARDPLGHETSGPVWSFTTHSSVYGPFVPVSPTPSSGATVETITPALAWSVHDPDPRDTLVFDVRLGTSPQPPLVASNVPTSAYQPDPVAFSMLYYWQIVSRDLSGVEATGPVWTFTTRPVNYPPAVPSNPTPVNGALDVPLDQSLSWRDSDADGEPLVYDVYFGTQSSPPLIATNVPTNAYQPAPLAFSTHYYWKIVAHDPSSGVTMGPVWAFTSRPVDFPPAVPSDPTPGDGALEVPVHQSLSWKDSDLEGEPLVYDVYFGTHSPPPRIATNLPNPTFDPGLLEHALKYYWRIVVRDSYGTEVSGPPWTFMTVANSAPNAPSDPVPPDNGITLLCPMLMWSASDLDSETLHSRCTSVRTPRRRCHFGAAHAGLPNRHARAVDETFWRVVASDGALTRSGPTWKFTARLPGDVNGDAVITRTMHRVRSGSMSTTTRLVPAV